jgi:hypothetical protein
VGTGELDALIGRMRALEGEGGWRDADDVERLQADLVEGLKAFEFALRRQLGEPEGDQPRLGGSDEVPAAWRARVEEYFRSLARTSGAPRR